MITGDDVVSNYLYAIGGKDKLMKINTLVTNGGLDLMGQQATLTIKIKAPNKMLNKMEMGGMVMQEQKFDGAKVSIAGMGQSETFGPGDAQFEQTKNQAKLFEQLYYDTDQYKVDLKGIENFEGAKHYKLIVTKGDLKETQFYAVKTSLLTATVKNEGEGEVARTVTTKLGDYKDADGIMLPYTMMILGAAPFPLEMKISSYGVNEPIADSEFEIK